MSGKIFVMPGGSQVGRLVVANLLRQGCGVEDVWVGGRRPEALADLGVTARHADYGKPDSLAAAFDGAETVVLIPSTAHPAPRCVEHANALAAARAAGAKRVLFLSILTAEPDSVSAIAPFTLFAENATRNSGLGWAILRMGLYMEPVAEWVPELIKMGRLPYPVSRGRVAYVTRDDVARCLAAVARDASRDGGVYKVAAPPVTMPELAAAVSAGIGQEIPFDACSDHDFIKICLDGEESPFITDVLLSLYRAVERGEFDQPTDDVERLTGQAAESVAAYFKRVLGEGGHGD